MSAADETIYTAAILVIGDEVLSGRTKDQNIGAIADFCASLGIELREARIVADDTQDIIDAVNALRARYSYVFTTGGIGPTHDDITADAVAAAFGVELPIDPESRALLEARALERGFDINEGMLRMARIPVGGVAIPNKISAAPGFRIGNVHVMAGVPKIMQAMLEEIAKTIVGGRKVFARELPCGVGESTVSDGLGRLQIEYPDVKIGSYPQLISQTERDSGLPLIYAYIALRSADEQRLEAATTAVKALLDELHAARNIKMPEEVRS